MIEGKIRKGKKLYAFDHNKGELYQVQITMKKASIYHKVSNKFEAYVDLDHISFWARNIEAAEKRLIQIMQKK